MCLVLPAACSGNHLSTFWGRHLRQAAVTTPHLHDSGPHRSTSTAPLYSWWLSHRAFSRRENSWCSQHWWGHWASLAYQDCSEAWRIHAPRRTEDASSDFQSELWNTSSRSVCSSTLPEIPESSLSTHFLFILCAKLRKFLAAGMLNFALLPFALLINIPPGCSETGWSPFPHGC